MESLLLAAFAVFYFTIYLVYYGKRTQLICKSGTQLHKILTTQVPSAHRRYFAVFWGYESRVITLLRYLTPCWPGVKFEREIVTSTDGGEFSLNWVQSKNGFGSNAPLALVVPGLTSTKDSAYISSLSSHLSRGGFRTTVMAYRGLDGNQVKVIIYSLFLLQSQEPSTN